MRTIESDNDEYGDVHLVGSIHISERTRERVMDSVDDVEPDTVAIELDQSRFERMWENHTGQNNQQDSGGLSEILRFIQRELIGGEMEPGQADMIPASEKAFEHDANLALVDQSMGVTGQRIVEELLSVENLMDMFQRFTDPQKQQEHVQEMEEAMEELGEVFGFEEDENPFNDPFAMVGSTGGVVDMFEEASYEEMDRMTDIMSTVSPISNVMVDERDSFMAERLHWLRARGDDVVAVVGKAHVVGIEENLGELEGEEQAHVGNPDFVQFNT